MDEAKLAKIEEWANDHVPRCYGCDGIARVIVPGTSRPLCAACAPNVPGAVLPLAPLVSVYATILDLIAEVRRLTAYTREVARILLDEVGTDGPTSAEYAATLAVAEVQVLRRERDEARAALATARREGAEEMRAKCKAVAEASAAHATQVVGGWPRFLVSKEIASEIAALTLDAPGGAT